MEPNTVNYISERLHYRFEQAEDLATCFVAPHRSEHDSPDAHTDGNRVWSNLGQTVITLVEAHNSLLEPRGSPQDLADSAKSRRAASTHAQWALSANNRADTCKRLGLHRYIKRSPRQQHEAPSNKILGNVMSAIVGVIWNEQLRREATISIAVEQISSILKHIELREPVCEELSGANEWKRQFHAFGLGSPPPSMFATLNTKEWFDRVSSFTSSTFSHMELDGTDISASLVDHIPETTGQALGDDGPLLHETDARERQPLVHHTTEDGNFTQDVTAEVTISSHSREPARCGSLRSVTSASTVVAKKVFSPRKRAEKLKEDHVEHIINEEWGRHEARSTEEKSRLRIFVQSNDILELAPTIESAVWRLLWYAIGSNQTLVGLVKASHEAKVDGVFAAKSLDTVSSPGYHLRMVVQMQQRTALNALLTRYHLMKAFTEASEIFQGYLNATQIGFVQGPRTKAGNPAFRAESEVIDEMLRMLDEDLVAGTSEYKKKRRFIKELSRAAKRLQVFTEVFGFGVLALIPYTNMDPDMDVDDKLLSELDLEKLRRFVNHLRLQQGTYLHQLCTLVAPVLEVLVYGQVKDRDTFPTNRLDIGAIVRLPKGSQEVLDLLAVDSSHLATGAF